MEKGGKVRRGLAQYCLINKLEPVSQSAGLEGGPVHQFEKLSVVCIKSSTAGKADSRMV